MAIYVLFKEFAQLQNLEAFEGILAGDLSQKQSSNALASNNLIKENRDGGINGESVADGRKQ